METGIGLELSISQMPYKLLNLEEAWTTGRSHKCTSHFLHSVGLCRLSSSTSPVSSTIPKFAVKS